MEKEISSGTMLGIVLIALAAVIGLGFGVFSIAKGVANEGTVNVQDNIGAVSESAFDDYNDKIVTGTMVRSALANFSGKSVAILVNTTAMNKGVVIYADHISTFQGYKFNSLSSITGGTSATITSTSNSTALETSGGKTSFKALSGISDAGCNYYINYNALLDLSSSNAGISYKDGIFNATSIPFLIDSTGKVRFDYSVGGQSRTGNCEYLNPTAKFDANLLKDETGTTIGVVFTQRAQ